MASHKNVTTERTTFTKAEREYVKGLVRDLSFQRLTDREIVQWLYDQKKIDLDRSTISKMRNQIEKDATKVVYIDTVIRAISELHRIEMSLRTMFKGGDIKTSRRGKGMHPYQEIKLKTPTYKEEKQRL